jgi:hypothetical protein
MQRKLTPPYGLRRTCDNAEAGDQMAAISTSRAESPPKLLTRTYLDALAHDKLSSA